MPASCVRYLLASKMRADRITLGNKNIPKRKRVSFMAKVLGESGRYVSNQAVAKRRKTWLLSIIVIAVVSLVEGLILGRWMFPVRLSASVSIPIMCSLLILMLWLCRSANKKMDMLEKERSAMQRGAMGEIMVGVILD
jgi:hypothetical protein